MSIMRESRGSIDGSQLGAELREARVRGGAQLADVAAELRIHFYHLSMMERGSFSELESGLATRHCRAYASYLGLDGDALVARLEAPPRERAPWRRFIPATAALVVVVLLAMLLTPAMSGDAQPMSPGAFAEERAPAWQGRLEH